MTAFTPESALQFAEADTERICKNLTTSLTKRERLATVVSNPVCIKQGLYFFKQVYTAMEADLKRSCARLNVSRINFVQLVPMRTDRPNDWIRLAVSVSILEPSI